VKVLIINTSDIDGGAARAAYRLHRALLQADVESKMLVQFKNGDDFTVIGPNSKYEMRIAKIVSSLDTLPKRWYKNRSRTLFSPAWVSTSKIVTRINQLKPDIVHLHWINGGMLRPEDLKRIEAPIVWSLHDMWAFSGGCHYDEDCGRFKHSCGRCLVLRSNRRRDLSSNVFSRKLKSYSKINSLTVVGLSQWLKSCAEKSPVFSEAKVINLPNPIDTKVFKPLDKNIARELLHLPKNKKLVLFGAIGAASDPRKGFFQLSRSLRDIDSKETELVVFGATEPKGSHGFKQKVHFLGRLYDDVSLCLLYSAADVMVVPSLQENLSNVIIESLSCGTPVVGFNIGGNPDIIIHKSTGYLANPIDIHDLTKGIAWILKARNYNELSRNARNKVLRDFDSHIVAAKYIDLYKDILNDD